MTASPLRILLVEDSFAVARELQSALSGLKGVALQVQHVETLGLALKLLGPDRFRFDCVMVDLRLPDCEGLASIYRLRARDAHTAIVAVAAPDDRDLAIESLRHGAQEFLVHPWLRTPELPNDLLRLIRTAIARKREHNTPDSALVGEIDAAAPVFPRDEDAAFALRFQPWTDVRGGTVCGVEALLAARSVQGTPREILSAVATRGELDALSHWVLRRVAPEWHKWRARGIAPPRLSVNISPVELHARYFARSRLALVNELGLLPGELQIELAEDALVGASVKVLAELQSLRAAGVAVVADNVGRAQAALMALGRLPLDGVKLDTSLIESVRHGDAAARAAVRGLVALCEELRISCCAVGVEVEPDDIACRTLGVHQIQGYWVARPQSASAVEAWLARCAPPVPASA